MNESDNNDECQMEDEHNEQTLSIFVSISAKKTKRKIFTNLNGKIIANIKYTKRSHKDINYFLKYIQTNLNKNTEILEF